MSKKQQKLGNLKLKDLLDGIKYSTVSSRYIDVHIFLFPIIVWSDRRSLIASLIVNPRSTNIG